LATTYRGREDEACSELWCLLKEVDDPNPVVEKTGVAGLIAAKTALNPFEVIMKLRLILRERPYEFRYTLRILPVEIVVRTEISEIKRAVEELSSKIGENETFRVTVEKRFTKTSTREIIEAAASKIERKVNLNNPDKILLIEVIGGLTGISIIKSEDVLSIVKEKMI
jgi:tRNA acetyltransferase TAN1